MMVAGNVRVKYSTLLSTVVLLLCFLLVSCSAETDEDNNKVAYVSANKEGEYERVFKDLGLGLIFDYNLKLTRADETWTDIWVEGYRDGQKVVDTYFTQLSFGRSPEKVSEGHMGIGIINPNSESIAMFAYAPGISNKPRQIGEEFGLQGASTWGYAIGDEEVGLEIGETKVLAAHITKVREEGRESAIHMRTYDYQNDELIDELIEEMIAENTLVFLLKIKVQEAEER